MLDFHTPTLDDAGWVNALVGEGGMASCDYGFSTLFIWRGYYKTKIMHDDGIMVISDYRHPPIYMIFVPKSDGERITKIRKTIDRITAYAHSRGELVRLFCADRDDKAVIDEYFTGRFTWEASEDDFDYIYNTADLANLPGKHYHGKRGHISAFSRKYDWKYETVKAENAGEIMEMLEKWCASRNSCSDPFLRYENRAIREALENMEALSLRGGLIRADGSIAAMTLGSPINSECFNIHFEKALPEYREAYAVINREFARNEILGKYPYINRENDMGIEGLRRAKLSYRPVRLLEKYYGEEMP